MGRPEGIPKVIFLTLKFFHWSQIWKHQQTSLAPKVQWHEEDELKPTMDHGALQNGGSRQKISNYWSGTFQKWFHGGPKKDAKCQELSNKKKRTFWCNKMQFFENLPVWFWKWFYLVKRLFFFLLQVSAVCLQSPIACICTSHRYYQHFMHSASCGMRFAAMQVKMKYMQEGNYNFFCVFAFLLLKDFQLQCSTKSLVTSRWIISECVYVLF